MEELEKSFGQKILQLRKARGWSQQELGERIGSSGVIVGRYERGEMMASIKVARKLADALGVTVDHLLADRDLPPSLGKQEMIQRVGSLDALPDEDRVRILYVVDSLIRDAQTRHAYRASA